MPTKLGSNTESHPFRQVAIASFAIAAVSVVCGASLLLAMKSDISSGDHVQALLKLGFGAMMVTYGARSFWRGYRDEYSFDLNRSFAPKQQSNVRHLLSSQGVNDSQARAELMGVMRSYSMEARDDESGMRNLEFLFFNTLSKKQGSRNMGGVPFPIARFAKQQVRPLLAVAFVAVFLLVYLFINYLGVIDVPFYIFSSLCTLALMAAMGSKSLDSYLLPRSGGEWLQQIGNMFIVLTGVYLVLSVFGSRGDAGMFGLVLGVALFAIVALIVWSSVLAFKIYDAAYADRRSADVRVSGGVHPSKRAATQPDAVRQQFDNAMLALYGWAFHGSVHESGQKLSGDNMRKGDYKLDKLFETQPQLVSTTYSSEVEKRLMNVWRVGTAMCCIGLIALTIAVFRSSLFSVDRFTHVMNGVQADFPDALLFMLVGTVFFVIGRKLVYETYLFCNTEMVFESTLVMFGIACNFDEYQLMDGNMLRRDTFTDYTLELRTAKVTSSVFLNPYTQGHKMSVPVRHVIEMDDAPEAYQRLLAEFDKNMSSYGIAIGVQHSPHVSQPGNLAGGKTIFPGLEG